MNMMTSSTLDQLARENDALRQRLDEAEALAAAIRESRVDAFVVAPDEAERVLVLQGCDHPYRRLVDCMQQGAVTISADGAIAYVNPSFAKMVDKPPAQLVGRKLQDLVPHVLQPLVAGLLVQGRENGGEGELLLWREDGTTFPAHVTASRLSNRDGVLCVIVTDLTVQKQHEEERTRYLKEQMARVEAERLAAHLRESERRTKEDLEDRIARRSEQIRKMALQLTRTERRERARLAQILHDDIQQLLVGLIIHARLALAGNAAGNELKMVINLAERSIEACRALTAELSPPVMQGDDFASTLKGLIQEMQLLHKLEVALRVDSPLPVLPAEVRMLLFSVTRELLFNVVKHAGVRQAQLSCGHVDGAFCIEVCDHGDGFDPAELQESPGGSFGLASIRQRLAAMGADVDIEASRGNGARIKVRYPL